MNYLEFEEYLSDLVARCNELAQGSPREEKKRLRLVRELGNLVGSTFHITGKPEDWGKQIDTFIAPYRIDLNHATEGITGFRFFFSEYDLGHHQLLYIDFIQAGIFYATVRSGSIVEVQVENVEEEDEE